MREASLEDHLENIIKDLEETTKYTRSWFSEELRIWQTRWQEELEAMKSDHQDSLNDLYDDLY